LEKLIVKSEKGLILMINYSRKKFIVIIKKHPDHSV